MSAQMIIAAVAMPRYTDGPDGGLGQGDAQVQRRPGPDHHGAILMAGMTQVDR